MSLYITSLNSGSNGNCYYVGNENEAVLVDAGISCREIEIRLKRLGLHIGKIKAVFVSHEHTDHVKGVSVFSTKHNIPVYISSLTLSAARLGIDRKLICHFNANDKICIGNLCITAFPKLHDAADPYSFTIAYNTVKVGVFTDIGLPCQHLISHFSECHAAFLESNYDDKMLDEGGYPFILKRRIKGGKGHLSNVQALELFKKYKPSYMSHLLLSHLSKNNNCPILVSNLFNEHKGDTEVVIASRFNETPVYHITTTAQPQTTLNYKLVAEQLAFSF